MKALWERIRTRKMLAVIGPSGVGKTSFLRAGVMAARPEGWAAISRRPGSSPLRGLGQALAPELAGDLEALRQLVGVERSRRRPSSSCGAGAGRTPRRCWSSTSSRSSSR